MRSVKGFTLVELMIVVALVAITATIAVPNFNNLIQNNRVQSQAEDLNALFQYARSESAIRKRSVTVSIDEANRRDRCSRRRWHGPAQHNVRYQRG